MDAIDTVSDDGTRVAAVDPRALMDDSRFAELADEAAQRLATALAHLKPATP